jgi:hypothetical protein
VKTPVPVLLRLEDMGSYVALVVVDAAGERVAGGCLMVLNENGYQTIGAVDRTLGLPLDGRGQLKEHIVS